MLGITAIFPPLTMNETVVFDALALSPEPLPVERVAEAAGLTESQTVRALRSLECRNPPLAVATKLAQPNWRAAPPVLTD
jgi:DNA-binding MarR family transcriptional regulator